MTSKFTKRKWFPLRLAHHSAPSPVKTKHKQVYKLDKSISLLDQFNFKGGGLSKKLTFLSPPRARKHSAVPHTEFSASKVPVILKKLVSQKEAQNSTSEASILKLVYVPSFRPTRNWREGKISQLNLHPLQGQQNVWLETILLKNSYA